MELPQGVITTLGLMIGLNAGTSSETAVLGGILVITFADALSDASGIHIAEESKGSASKDIWIATGSTFLTKFIFAFSFVIPVVLFSLDQAVKISILLGLFYLSIFSFYLAKRQNKFSWSIIFEYLLITILVIIISQFFW